MGDEKDNQVNVHAWVLTWFSWSWLHFVDASWLPPQLFAHAYIL